MKNGNMQTKNPSETNGKDLHIAKESHHLPLVSELIKPQPTHPHTEQPRRKGMGWLRSLPDLRDYTPEHPEIEPLLKKAHILHTNHSKTQKTLPTKVDLRAWFSPIEDQGYLGSCTSQAGVALVEYFQKRAFGKHIDASRLFVYKMTRNLLRWTGDTGAYMRSTMGALALFGAPPEEYWPYTDDSYNFDLEPPTFCYAFAQNYQALKYFRLDPPTYSKDQLLKRIKTNIAAGIPAMFGFSVYSSSEYQAASNGGKFPFPSTGDFVVGGHAVVTAGYDDEMEILNTDTGVTTKGAFLIRNSWGESWGEMGYGWLPYDYVIQGLADDWWCLLKSEWVDTGNFGE